MPYGRRIVQMEGRNLQELSRKKAGRVLLSGARIDLGVTYEKDKWTGRVLPPLPPQCH